MLQEYPQEMIQELSTLTLEFQSAVDHATTEEEITTLAIQYANDKAAIYIKYNF
jgi:hypothetical protein